MRRAWILAAGVSTLVAGVYALNAQQVSQPVGPAGIACAYNASPPTITTGNAGWAQCDSVGRLLTVPPAGGDAVTIADGADVAQGTTTDAACSTDNGTCTIEAVLKRIAQRVTTLIASVGSPLQAGGNIGTVTAVTAITNPIAFSSQYPSGATAITASTTGTTGATTATLAGTGGKTTFVCGFTITSDATAALAGSATVTGTITGTLNYIQNVGSATAAGLLSQTFFPCVPASAVNTGIAINSVAAGTGGNTAVSAWGYQL